MRMQSIMDFPCLDNYIQVNKVNSTHVIEQFIFFLILALRNIMIILDSKI